MVRYVLFYQLIATEAKADTLPATVGSYLSWMTIIVLLVKLHRRLLVGR